MKNILLSLILSFPLFAWAQNSTVSTGGDAKGKTGTTSYSVGQLFYASALSENGSSTPGVQQAYEITEMPAFSDSSLNLKMTVYPNPTTHLITLQIEDSEVSGLSFVLLGMTGQILKTGAVRKLRTEVPMDNLGAAIYLLKVFSNNELIKTFQIIKKN